MKAIDITIPNSNWFGDLVNQTETSLSFLTIRKRVVIDVKQDTQVFELNEDWEWVCSHANHEIVEDEFDDSSYSGEYNSYTLKVWECQDCYAWQHSEVDWDGIVIGEPKKGNWSDES
jgi:hypothetical protein